MFKCKKILVFMSISISNSSLAYFATDLSEEKFGLIIKTFLHTCIQLIRLFFYLSLWFFIFNIKKIFFCSLILSGDIKNLKVLVIFSNKLIDRNFTGMVEHFVAIIFVFLFFFVVKINNHPWFYLLTGVPERMGLSVFRQYLCQFSLLRLKCFAKRFLVQFSIKST
jgi:hypothetical protein